MSADKKQSFYETEAEKVGYFYFDRRIGERACAFGGGADAYTPPHFHSSGEIYIVFSGEVGVVLGGEARVLKAGDGCFADSFDVHSYRYDGIAEAYCIVGSGDYFDFVFGEGGVLPRFFKFDDFALLDRMFENYSASLPSGARAAFVGALGTLVGAISANYPLVKRKKGGDEELICAALGYVHEHFREDITLGSVARSLGYTQEYLSAVFHKYLREGFRTYLNGVRLIYAKRLIKGGKTTVEAAYESGFGSMTTFYRACRGEESSRAGIGE